MAKYVRIQSDSFIRSSINSIVILCLFEFVEMKLTKKSTAGNSFSYATKTPGLDFVMDISEVKTSFKVFY